MSEDTVRLVVDVPKNLRTEVNILAKQQDTTVKKIVNDLLENFVRENKE